jgi:DNA-binding NarL/FixJ family response regulator
MQIDVLTIDGHELVLLGLQELFTGTEIQIAATAKSADDAMKKISRRKPDLVLIEVRLQGRDGLALLKQIKLKCPAQPVIIFSGQDDPIYVARAYASGAAGYMLKRDPPIRLINAIRRVVGGDSAWTEGQLQRITGGLSGDYGRSLTSRESEVLQQVSHGLTNKEIATALAISYDTVKEHVQHILRKVGAKDRTQAAVWAVRREMALASTSREK